MSSFKRSVISATVLLAMAQFCPTFFGPAIAEAAAVGFPTVRDVQTFQDLTSEDRRSEDHQLEDSGASASDANQLAWKLCHEQLGSASPDFSSPAKGSVLAEGVPPACMTISTVLTGKFNEGNPVAMSSNSIQFSHLSDEGIKKIKSALSPKKAS